jgi:hypothetical protein
MREKGICIALELLISKIFNVDTILKNNTINFFINTIIVINIKIDERSIS